MPSHIRIFWWLSTGAVAFLASARIWFLVFPSAHHLSMMARLPPELRDATRQADIMDAIIYVGGGGIAELVLAWFAAFRRANWARWAYAALFVLGKLMPFAALAISFHQLDFSLLLPPSRGWGTLLDYAISSLMLAAIISVFSGNARTWFDRNDPPIR
jgi:hypothetical protein